MVNPSSLRPMTMGLAKGRLEALSDGVIAIVITLLVLLLEPPSAAATDDRLIDEIVSMSHIALAYVVSFVIVGFYWWRHHVIFHYLRRVDRQMVGWNILFLLSVALIPFPTDLLIEFMFHPEVEVAVIIYGMVHVVCGLCLYGMWRHAVRTPDLLIAEPTAELTDRMGMHLLSKPLIALATIAVSLFSVPLALSLYALIPLSTLLPRSRSVYEVDIAYVEGG